ncbi:MAG: prepilin peptidase [Deltaproteobacteria bacterium]|nr:prepilin peptidase [Deltaproteobacteria bacterium]
MIAESAFGLAMMTTAVSDLRQRRIPNALNLAVLLCGLGVRALMGGPSALALGLAGAGTGLALLIVLFHARWIGGGDVKLAMAIGAWLGPEGTLLATLLGLAGGGVLAGFILLTSGRALRTEVIAHLKVSFWTLSPPPVVRRGKRQVVPMAIPLGAAAIGVMLFYLGGFHV